VPWFRNDIRVGGEQGLQIASGIMPFARGDGRNHACLGAICNHVDRIHEQFPAFGLGIEGIFFGRLPNPDVLRGGLSVFLHGLTLPIEAVDFLPEAPHRPVVPVRLLPARIPDAIVQSAESATQVSDATIETPSTRIDNPGLGVLLIECMPGPMIEIELLAHVPEPVFP